MGNQCGGKPKKDAMDELAGAARKDSRKMSNRDIISSTSTAPEKKKSISLNEKQAAIERMAADIEEPVGVIYEQPEVVKEYSAPSRKSTKKKRSTVKKPEPEIPVAVKPDVIPHPSAQNEEPMYFEEPVEPPPKQLIDDDEEDQPPAPLKRDESELQFAEPLGEIKQENEDQEVFTKNLKKGRHSRMNT